MKKRTRKVLAEHFDGGRHFLFADLVVLALLRVGLQTLPRQRTAIKVHEHETQRLQIVTTTLFCFAQKKTNESNSQKKKAEKRNKCTNAEVSIDRGVASSAGQRLVLDVRNVLVSLGVSGTQHQKHQKLKKHNHTKSV
jgi:hypothetical protein